MYVGQVKNMNFADVTGRSVIVPNENKGIKKNLKKPNAFFLGTYDSRGDFDLWEEEKKFWCRFHRFLIFAYVIFQKLAKL